MIKVLKFGGTSVANAATVAKVTSIIQTAGTNDKWVVVVSALGGMTDTLQQAGELANAKNDGYLELFQRIIQRHEIMASQLQLSNTVQDALHYKMGSLKSVLEGIYLINEFSAKTRDKVLGYGELLSSFIISESLKKQKIDAQFKDSRELIVTDSNHTQAQVIKGKTHQNIQDYFTNHRAQITVLPGFIAQNEAGDTTTLGRGGSDYTAAILAAALGATTLEIWTDVSGMYTANPKIVKQAFPISDISYQEAMELSHFGAKVLYPPTIRPVLGEEIPIVIKNTFDPDAVGTRITQLVASSNPVKGISHLPNIALLTMEGAGMVGVSGFSKRLFETLSAENINVILITQASSEHSICVAVQESEMEVAKDAIDTAFAYEISLGKIQPVAVEDELAIIAVIGDQMKNHQGISGKMFSALGKNNVNIRAIAQGASERNISAVIAAKDVKKALNTLHYRFFERQVKTLHLFVVGVGNVGARLLAQIKQQQTHLYDHLFLQVRVVGLSNSRKMLFNEEGVDLDHWEEALNGSEDKTNEAWFQRIKYLNLQNSVFIDITANDAVAHSYDHYLKESIAVIACNKVACSSKYNSYQNLKNLSKKYSAPFLFETNVGAGLPVINTLYNLINSGDEITSIKAVLSGSLNFVFNNFDEKTSFYDVVMQAGTEGYTEPDPRIDLSGVDVARKILILARESGNPLEMEDIENISFLPQSSNDAVTVEDFYDTLKSEASHFDRMLEAANRNGTRLKYVAEYTNGKAKVSLEEVGVTHPFYNLDGKDNIVLFYTKRYVEQPLIIKGAGAGADVTASGLFGDIISLGNK